MVMFDIDKPISYHDSMLFKLVGADQKKIVVDSGHGMDMIMVIAYRLKKETIFHIEEIDLDVVTAYSEMTVSKAYDSFAAQLMAEHPSFTAAIVKTMFPSARKTKKDILKAFVNIVQREFPLVEDESSDRQMFHMVCNLVMSQYAKASLLGLIIHDDEDEIREVALLPHVPSITIEMVSTRAFHTSLNHALRDILEKQGTTLPRFIARYTEYCLSLPASKVSRNNLVDIITAANCTDGTNDLTWEMFYSLVYGFLGKTITISVQD